jgi:hypothetical protein
MRASAAGVSRLAVGALTPGTTDERLATARNTKRVPTKGTSGAGSLCTTPRI